MSIEQRSAKLRQTIEEWEKAVEKFVREERKAGEAGSAEMGKRLKEMQVQGEKIAKMINEESSKADKNLRKVLTDFDQRVKVAQDKMSRALEELKK